VRGFSYARTWRGLDYYQFWVVGQAVSRLGDTDVYSEEGRKRIGGQVLDSLPRETISDRLVAAVSRRKVLETYSTPFLYTLAGTLASGRYDADQAGFAVLSLVCGIAGVLGLCRVLRYSPLAASAAVLLLAELFAPYRSDLRVGNVNLIQLGLLSAFLCVRSLSPRRWRDPAAGAILGFAVMFKPNLAHVAAMLALGWLVNRRFGRLASVAAGAAASGVAAFTASVLFFGTWRAWSGWLAAVRSLPDDIVGIAIGNFALARMLGDAVGRRAVPLLAIAVLATAFGSLWAGRRAGEGTPAAARDDDPRREALGDLLLVGAGCLAYLLTAPLVWVHYFVLAIPLALALLRPAADAAIGRAGARELLAGIAVVLLANRPLEALVGQGHPALVAITSNLGALLLLGLALAALRRARVVPVAKP